MAEHPAKPPRSVLVVDDSEDDVLLLSMTLQQAQLPWVIAGVLHDGEQAIQWLQKGYSAGSRAMHRIDLLLIDLKMPRRDGFDVLHWVQRNLQGRFTIVVFSSSFAIADIMRARELGADFYFVKPVLSDDRRKILLNLERLLSAHGTEPRQPGAHFEAVINSVLAP
jgi:CheY-like chemotaxis protein